MAHELSQTDGGRMGGDLDHNGKKVLELVLNAATYRGLSRDKANAVIDEAIAGMSKKDQRIAQKLRKK